ncbi:hypothetical protein D3C86_1892900 [compost metagenome]
MLDKKLANNFPDPQVADLVPIFRIHGNINYNGPQGVKPEQQIRLEKETLADFSHREVLRDLTMDRRISVRGVEQIPVSRRQLRHER